jgi:phosphopentomutase
MSRAFLLVMDSFGIGAAHDAASFGDAGADTLGHIADTVDLALPNLVRLGLGEAAVASTGKRPRGFARVTPEGAFGYAVETSRGKDTPSGHWELAGVPVAFEWGYFPPDYPSFPAALTDELVGRAGLPGILGNRHASGTQIIDELGAEHIRTGKPICYTSADSVFQIAAHEEHFGLERLYDVCKIARSIVDRWNIGRVIARPFVGAPGSFKRTAHRKDLAVPPPAPTLLDRLVAAGGAVHGIGKIGDIFAGQGVTRSVKAADNEAGFAATLAAADGAEDRTLVFINFNDFDTLYGHRRDPVGYARALEAFDARLPALEARLRPGDLAVISADHGCDPTYKGTDHTREHVPVLAFGPGVAPGALGRRAFADVGQTIARHLGLAPLPEGAAFG